MTKLTAGESGYAFDMRWKVGFTAVTSGLDNVLLSLAIHLGQ